VCRFELATDNQEYEAGRLTRMQGRMARLKEGELRVMRIPDLKRLMAALGVSGDGCVEKADLIKRLGATPGVELAPDREDISYEEGDLRSLELPLLRSLLERHCVPLPMSEVEEEEEEHAEAIRRLAAAGLIDVKVAAALLNMQAMPVRVKPLAAAQLTLATPQSAGAEGAEEHVPSSRTSSKESRALMTSSKAADDDDGFGSSSPSAFASRSVRRASSNGSRQGNSTSAAEESSGAASSEAGPRNSSRNAGGPLRPSRPAAAPPAVTRPRPGGPPRRVRNSEGAQR